MTASNHMLTGAAIAVMVRQPLLAILLAIISHYLLDTMPHFGIEEEEVEEKRKGRLFWTVFAIDVALLVAWLALLPHMLDSHIAPWIVWTTMIAAYIPDAVWLYRFAYRQVTGRYKRRSKLTQFHANIQHEYVWGIVIEAIWCSALLGGLMAVAR